MIRRIIVLASLTLVLFSVPVAAQVNGYIDKVVPGPSWLSPYTLMIEGWVDSPSGNEAAVIRVWDMSQSYEAGVQVIYNWAWFVRPDVNKAFSLPPTRNTGWRFWIACNPGTAYQIWSENISGYWYAVCEGNVTPSITARVVNQKGKPLGMNTPSGWLEAKLLYLEEEYSYQPRALQNYYTGNGVVVNGVLKSWYAMDEGWYTLIVEGYGMSVGEKTFFYPGYGPVDLGTLTLHEHLVDLEIKAPEKLVGTQLDYELKVNNRSGKKIEVYTIVRMPGTTAEIPFEKNRSVQGLGESSPYQQSVMVPSWAPRGLYVTLEVIAIEEGLQHTVLGRRVHWVYIGR